MLLNLPTTMPILSDLVVKPAIAVMGLPYYSQQALVMLCAIAGQETGLLTRYQGNNGPARGIWQFEIAGIETIMQHQSASGLLASICDSYRLPFDAHVIWNELPTDDFFACQVARTLLWCDPKPLPAIDDEQACWDYYLENWEPGRPDASRWAYWFPLAVKSVGELNIPPNFN